jgi:uncharacterized protein with HEPN domain
MDKPTSKERLEHVLESIALIRHFINGVDVDAFSKEAIIQSAVQYQFLIIGEAIKNIDENILVKYNYPWHIPRSFRNFIAHEYHGIRPERIYYAANDLMELEKQILSILKNEF